MIETILYMGILLFKLLPVISMDYCLYDIAHPNTSLLHFFFFLRILLVSLFSVIVSICFQGIVCPDVLKIDWDFPLFLMEAMVGLVSAHNGGMRLQVQKD